MPICTRPDAYPSSSSIDNLYLIYQKKIDFISLLKDYSKNCDGIIAKNSYWKIFYKVSSNCNPDEFIDFIQKGKYFLSLLNEYYITKGVLITNNSLWERFYNAFMNYSYGEIQEFFYKLALISSKDHQYFRKCYPIKVIWERFYIEFVNYSCEEIQEFLYKLNLLNSKDHQFILECYPLKVIWEEIINDSRFDKKNLEQLSCWNQMFLRLSHETNFDIAFLNCFKRALIENKNNLLPIQPETQKLLSSLVPVLFSIHFRELERIIHFLNSDYFTIPEYISKISAIIYLLITLLSNNWQALRKTLELFVETHHYFYRFILYKQPVTKIQYLKYLIREVIMFTKSTPRGSGYHYFNEDLLITLYIISSYNEKIINPIESFLKPNNEGKDIIVGHKWLFIKMFIRYETPWYFIENLTSLTHRELNILFQLLEGKNLKSIVKLAFPVTNKDIHRFIFYPSFLVKYCDDVVNTGLFWAKFDNFMFHENVHFPLNEFFRNRISIADIINDYNFWIELLSFFKKNELLIQYTQVGPILDYFINRRYQRGYTINFQINGRSLNRILNDMEQWHLNLHQENNVNGKNNKIWTGHLISNFNTTLNGISYSIIQLKSDEELFTEGKMMNHCVYSYRNSCYKGSCSIWSLRRDEINGVKTRLATIEVQNNNIIQVRRNNNILPGKLEEIIINEWSEKAGLLIDYL